MFKQTTAGIFKNVTKSSSVPFEREGSKWIVLTGVNLSESRSIKFIFRLSHTSPEMQKKKQIEIELTFFVKKSFYDIFTVNIRPSLNDFRLSSAWFYLVRIYYIKNKVFTKHFGGRMTPNFKGRRVIFQYYILSASIKKYINK